MAEWKGTPHLFVGLIYGEPKDTDDSTSDIEERLKEFDDLEGVDKWKHVCALAGLALYRAQLFEADLLNILLMHSRVMGVIATEEEYDALETDLTGKTLGGLLNKVGKLVDISADATQLLQCGRQRRNELCHGFFFRRSEELLTVAGQRRVCRELLETIDHLQRAEFVSQIICNMLIKLSGRTLEDLEAEVEADKLAARIREGEALGG